MTVKHSKEREDKEGTLAEDDDRLPVVVPQEFIHDQVDLSSVHPSKLDIMNDINDVMKADFHESVQAIPNAITATSASRDLDGRNSLLSAQQSIQLTIRTSRDSNLKEKTIWTHPRLRKNAKTIFGAVFLCIVGMGMVAAAVYEFMREDMITRAIVFLISGIVTGIPGFYMCYYIYKAFRGSPGYHFSGIPSFDN